MGLPKLFGDAEQWLNVAIDISNNLKRIADLLEAQDIALRCGDYVTHTINRST